MTQRVLVQATWRIMLLFIRKRLREEKQVWRDSVSLGLNLLLLTCKNGKGLTKMNRLIQHLRLGLKKYKVF